MDKAKVLDILLDTWRNRSGAVYSDEYIARFETEGYCRVMANGSLEGIAESIIQRETEHHRALKRSFEWTHLSCDEPTDMLERLVAHGFRVGEKEVVCAFDLADGELGEPAERVEPVRDAHTLADFRSVAESVFEKDFAYTTGVLADNFEFDIPQEYGFVAYDGDQPVSIGRLSHPEGGTVAGLYTGGTVCTHRGKGFYRSVVQARAQFARELGIRYLSVDARSSSLPILESLGFRPIVESWPCDYLI